MVWMLQLMKAAQRTCISCQTGLKSLNRAIYLQQSDTRCYSSEPPEPYPPETTAINQVSQASASETALLNDNKSLLSSAKIHSLSALVTDRKQDLFSFPYPSLNPSDKDLSQPTLPIGNHPQRQVEGLDSQPRANHSKLVTILETVDHSDDTAVDHLFELYNGLPAPRVCYLSRGEVQKLFIVLSRQDNTLNKVGNQLMMIIKDMQNNQTTVRQLEWQCLIDAIGKGYNFEETVRMDLVAQNFYDMEQSGQPARIATLASLLQTAVRLDSPPMYNYVNEEIRRQTNDDNLIVWTTRMKWAGKQRNVELINKTYAEFWEKGIPLDIIFVNAFLEAFIRSNEPRLAELLYLRFRTFILHRLEKNNFLNVQVDKITDPKKKKIAVRKARAAFLEGGGIRKVLEEEFTRRRIGLADFFNKDGTPTQTYTEFVRAVDPANIKKLIPQESTTRLFLSYHCYVTGRMEDVAFYLNEMKTFNIEPLYSTYVNLLHGFFLWHNPEGDWNATRLENVFSFIRRSVVNGHPPFPITYALILTAIRAFGKVKGGKSAREVWELLRPWLKVNDNAKEGSNLRISRLEKTVVCFESGKGLNWEMSGGNLAWRILPDYDRD
jgi:hypothetical protein